MSYNIDAVKILRLEASIEATKLLELDEVHLDELPEFNWLAAHEDAARTLVASGVNPAMVKLRSFDWNGTWSGNSFEEVLIKRIAPHIMGLVEVVLTWEDGASFSGLRIKDGVVTQPKVTFALEGE